MIEMVVLVLVVNKIKQLLCKHSYETLTNFYGDYILEMSIFSSKIIRSLRKCKKCGKVYKSEFLDKNCPIINFDILYEDGKFKYIGK